jgi:hypothetical protein
LPRAKDMDARSPARPQKKWGPALLPAPTAPSEGYAGVRNLVRLDPKTQTNPLSILAHQLRRRFPSDCSLLRGARPIYSTARPEGSLVFRSVRPAFGSRSLRTDIRGENRPMFHGPSWGNHSCVPLRLFRTEVLRRAASRERIISSSGASSRLAPPLLRRASTLPAGGDRILGHLPPLRAVAGFRERLGPQSRSQAHHALLARVGEAKNAVKRLWITGISGTTAGTFSRAPFGCLKPLRLLPPPSA